MHDLSHEELISYYLDDELPSDERLRVERLLAQRDDLRQLHDELLAVRTSLRALPPQRLEADFSQQVLRRAEREMLVADAENPPEPSPDRSSADRRYVPRPFRSPRSWLWAGVAIAAAVLVSVFAPREPEEQGPVVARQDPPQNQRGSTTQEATEGPVEEMFADQSAAGPAWTRADESRGVEELEQLRNQNDGLAFRQGGRAQANAAENRNTEGVALDPRSGGIPTRPDDPSEVLGAFDGLPVRVVYYTISREAAERGDFDRLLRAQGIEVQPVSSVGDVPELALVDAAKRLPATNAIAGAESKVRSTLEKSPAQSSLQISRPFGVKLDAKGDVAKLPEGKDVAQASPAPDGQAEVDRILADPPAATKPVEPKQPPATTLESAGNENGAVAVSPVRSELSKASPTLAGKMLALAPAAANEWHYVVQARPEQLRALLRADYGDQLQREDADVRFHRQDWGAVPGLDQISKRRLGRTTAARESHPPAGNQSAGNESALPEPSREATLPPRDDPRPGNDPPSNRKLLDEQLPPQPVPNVDAADDPTASAPVKNPTGDVPVEHARPANANEPPPPKASKAEDAESARDLADKDRGRRRGGFADDGVGPPAITPSDRQNQGADKQTTAARGHLGAIAWKYAPQSLSAAAVAPETSGGAGGVVAGANGRDAVDRFGNTPVDRFGNTPVPPAGFAKEEDSTKAYHASGPPAGGEKARRWAAADFLSAANAGGSQLVRMRIVLQVVDPPAEAGEAAPADGKP